MISFTVLVLLMLIGFLAPLIAPYNPYDPASIDIMNSEIRPPGWTRARRIFCSAPTSRGGIF